jgi:hypothetical protein
MQSLHGQDTVTKQKKHDSNGNEEP